MEFEMKTQVKRPVYDMEADIELPAEEEGKEGVEVDDVEKLDEDECQAVKAVIGFDPRTVEQADDRA